ncbi:hypothetical protein [Paracoccus cavernae]|uniref:hypothetical protein n=1 Tax=Paracoccus cavernae TaxID=1571207 RepID=UPI00362D0DC2
MLIPFVGLGYTAVPPFPRIARRAAAAPCPVAAAYRRINKGLLPDGVAPTIFRINTGDE